MSGSRKREETRKRFDDVASSYDTRFVRIIDRYEEMQSMMCDLVSRLRPGASRILDLGTGTGEMARLMLERDPSVHVHGVDFSGEMLSRARGKLAPFGDRFSCEVADLAGYGAGQPFEVVMSALAIHHLVDEDKESLTQRMCRILPPGGVFINGDLVRGETEAEQSTLHDLQVESMRRRGATEDEISERLARHRQYDIPARLSDQLRWLRDSGCPGAWVPWRHLNQAVLVGIRGT